MQNICKFWDRSGSKECKSCRSRKMLQNASLLAIVAVDTAENEPSKVWRSREISGARNDFSGVHEVLNGLGPGRESTIGVDHIRDLPFWCCITNFRRLVLGCMDSYDSEQRRILQHFSRSTRFASFCTVLISEILKICVKIWLFLPKFRKSFAKILNFTEIQKNPEIYAKFLQKICKFCIFFSNFYIFFLNFC